MRYKLCYFIRTYKVYDCNYSVSGYHMQTILDSKQHPSPLRRNCPILPFLISQPLNQLSYPALTDAVVCSSHSRNKSNKRLHLLGLSSSVGSDVGGCFYYLCPLPFFLIVQYSTTFYYAARVNPPVPLYSLRSSAKLPRGTFTSKPPVTSENV